MNPSASASTRKNAGTQSVLSYTANAHLTIMGDKPFKEPLAPGAALGLEITVEKADGAKCPRCWKYHTVQGNPQGICDGCVIAILEGLPYWVETGVFTQEQ